MPPPCFQRPWRSISCVGAPFWVMRRAMPTRPLWPLKNSQSARPAARATAFTRRAIWDSDNPNTFAPPPTPDGRMASSARMAAGVTATTAPWASVSVLERMTVMRPLPSSQRWASPPGQRPCLGTPQSPVGQHGHQGQVEAGAFSRLRGRFHAAAAATGLDGGEPDDGQDVGGEGDVLALGSGQPTTPTLQRLAHAPVPAGRIVAGPFVYLGDGGGGQAQGGNTGAGAGRTAR